ncbi:hypothetical protein O181_031376 [Austropuccinia psidii MF-1]|uniref:Uncharacterized protein n=1 Tax=Austropuccinia psidii MF-1 TaxID=1389203 RepID=A0A9Q3D0C7_9BASI|nr:hypothetical protein [Austropuccinia psidii MF-1]
MSRNRKILRNFLHCIKSSRQLLLNNFCTRAFQSARLVILRVALPEYYNFVSIRCSPLVLLFLQDFPKLDQLTQH